MNGARSDASTSTDDGASRPLCLFYFTHPFGVLSPEPPTLAPAPPHVARAFLNMQPVPPFHLWSPPHAAPPPPPAPSDDDYVTSASSRPAYELGSATVHRAPLSVLRVTRTRTLELGGDSFSSSLLSSDAWLSGSSGRADYPRRLVPYNKILPPLHLPSPKDSSNLSSSDDFWPTKCLNPEKFSLPPIELPSVSNKVKNVKILRSKKCSLSSAEVSSVDSVSLRGVGGARGGGRVRRPGVAKPRRARAGPADLRRLLTALMRRTLTDGAAERNVSPALRDALHTIREAWAEPRSLYARCRTVSRWCAPPPPPPPALMESAAPPPPPAGASPGLLRRRYSVPETIMRKYRLAQQRSDSEESAPPTGWSATSPGVEAVQRGVRRDRELMRRSALLRRMWGRGGEPCCCCEPPPLGRETRSLDGSRSELRPLSSALTSSRHSHAAAAGWASPKRQRIDSARDCRSSDEMLRAAMRNSYDRAEETRHHREQTHDYSDSTYHSHEHRLETTSYIETVTDNFTDTEVFKSNGERENNAFTQYSEQQSSDTTATVEMKSVTTEEVHELSDQSAPSTGATEQVAGRVSEHSRGDNDALPYDKPLAVHTTPYELLEIVVSETLNVNAVPAISAHTVDTPHTLKTPSLNQKGSQNINIDEYVSNILVESLNSLSDQIECMNASMGNDRKISIVEKEIKVKLQNTGVNTIVHLSPTSNNQIIFGNEELCNNDERKDECNNPHEALSIREEALSVESNNNVAPAECCDAFDLQHDAVNQAVLQQIQKLFHDELHTMRSDTTDMPEISHIEISNVTDVFIDNETEMAPVVGDAPQPMRSEAEYEVMGGVGAGNYFPDLDDNPVVPRFSAFPHTDSMEVNTSSSDDGDLMGSDCTSLVDSLDDPNSPRSVMLRRNYTNRRSELVRSAIDVLDLLPENAYNDDTTTPKDKGESFFIKIQDNDCDCDKENVNVADRMPEKIKQRLYRRHRKREMRMECARRTRGKVHAREADREHDNERRHRNETRHDNERRHDIERRHEEHWRHRRAIERDCLAIVNALIDDVIGKIAQEEYKCMRIKQKPNRMLISKSDDNIAKRTWKKKLEPIDDKEPFKLSKNNGRRYDDSDSMKQKSDRHQIHGKLSLLTRPKLASDDRAAKRIYQKSEIHDGNKCIEILEILEYVNGSQSSPDTTTSDENQNHNLKNKKSRIPIPISERIQRTPNSDSYKSSSRRSSVLRGFEHRSSSGDTGDPGSTGRLLADMLLEALGEPETPALAPRRAAPPLEPRSRSNSLRFKQTFDIIPEERSSLSLDSSTDDVNHNRRASAPDIADHYRESSDAECAAEPLAPPSPQQPRRLAPTSPLTKLVKSAATSPMTAADCHQSALKCKNQTTMTSPGSKSAATSPLRAPAAAAREQGCKESAESDKTKARRSVSTQHERVQRVQDSTRRAERAAKTGSRRPPPEPPAATNPAHPEPVVHDTRKHRTFSLDKSEEEAARVPSIKLPEFKGGGDSSTDSSESGSSLLCSLAPKWLSHGRRGRAARRRQTERAAPVPEPPAPPAPPDDPPGGWSVTVAGSCRAALPADVEMRLRFPHERDADEACQLIKEKLHGKEILYLRTKPSYNNDRTSQECTCRHCATCACGARVAPPPHAAPRPLPPPARPRLARSDSSKLTLTMKKEALDSSILASKSMKKSGEPLPDVETYRASRSKLKSSVKTRRGYSLHCWLPENGAVPIRSDGLSVLGSAIVPELKPRVRTMSERDLTRHLTPRHYLRI